MFRGPNDCLSPNGRSGSPAAPWSFPDQCAAKQSTASSGSISAAHLSAVAALGVISFFFHHYHLRHYQHYRCFAPPRRDCWPNLREVVCLFELIMRCLSASMLDFPSTQTVMQQLSNAVFPKQILDGHCWCCSSGDKHYLLPHSVCVCV